MMIRPKRLVVVIFIAAIVAGCQPLFSSSLPPTSSPPPLLTVTPPVPATIPLPPGVEPTATPSPVPTPVPTPVESESLPEIVLDVELFYAERWMSVSQSVQIENTTADTWDEIVFSVPVHYLPDVFYLDSVLVTQGIDRQEGLPTFEDGDTMLHVPLPRSLLPGGKVVINMQYRVVFPPIASTDWPPLASTGWTLNLIQAGEWYPALVPYIEGEGWHTWRYHPVGDPTIYPLTNISLNVRAGEGITVASGGPQGPVEDGLWRFRVERARGVAFLASDQYETASGEVDGIPITSYYLPDHAEAGSAAVDIASEAITLFEELYGPYPYDNLTIAENGYFGGMEYSALVSITDYAYYTFYGLEASVLHVLTAHEIGHQWWYGAVGNDQVNEPWLDESMAFYGELLYYERYHPEYVNWWWESRVTQYNPYGPVDATIYSYSDSASFIFSMYGQAALFMADLRETMGDEAFFAFIKDYYQTYQWQTVTADDFFAAARRHTDQDLTPLLTGYFADPEH